MVSQIRSSFLVSKGQGHWPSSLRPSLPPPQHSRANHAYQSATSASTCRAVTPHHPVVLTTPLPPLVRFSQTEPPEVFTITSWIMLLPFSAFHLHLKPVVLLPGPLRPCLTCPLPTQVWALPPSPSSMLASHQHTPSFSPLLGVYSQPATFPHFT